MSFPNGASLTSEQMAKAQEWVEQKITNTTCPLCDSEEFGVGEHLVDLPLFMAERTRFGHQVVTYPQFQLLCVNCGYTRLINAVVSGIIPASEVTHG